MEEGSQFDLCVEIRSYEEVKRRSFFDVSWLKNRLGKADKRI